MFLRAGVGDRLVAVAEQSRQVGLAPRDSFFEQLADRKAAFWAISGMRSCSAIAPSPATPRRNTLLISCRFAARLFRPWASGVISASREFRPTMSMIWRTCSETASASRLCCSMARRHAGHVVHGLSAPVLMSPSELRRAIGQCRATSRRVAARLDRLHGAGGLTLDRIDELADLAGRTWKCSASLRTSSATTAKPRPCSPARAASMAH